MSASVADRVKLVAPIPAVADPVRFQQPELPPLAAIAPYYALAEEAGFYSNGGPCAQLLATRLADHLGGGLHAIPVANCTVGLMAALHAVCGAPTARRPLVAVPSFTFTATASAVIWAGFEPVLIDVLDDCWQLDPAHLEQVIERDGDRLAGVLGCSTFGTPPPAAVRAAWRRLCAGADVPLLFDSAAAFGAHDEHGRLAGSCGETEVFSFHATKPFAVGEGGAIVTPDPDVAARVRRLINFGMEPGGRSSAVAGINAKCSELHAATALAVLDRFDDMLARRRATASRVRRALVATGAPLAFQIGCEGSTHQTCQLAVRDADDRRAALAAAQRLGVQARAYFDPPLHRQPAYARWAPAGGLPATDRLAARALSLPMANDLADGHVERIAGVVGALADVPRAA